MVPEKMRGDRLPLYLSSPGLLCCAGKDGEQVFGAVLAGEKGNVVSPQRPEEVSFLSIPEEFLGASPVQSGERDFGEHTRILRICAAALEQIRGDVERVRELYGPERVGVCVGSCDNSSEWSLRAHEAFFKEGRFPPSYCLPLQGAFYPAGYVSRYFGLSGPSLVIATACASGAGAVVKGAELIRAGLCDAAIVGGIDLASPPALRGFASLEVLSGELCNPFSRNRKGTTLGDGVAFFVLAPGTGEDEPRGIELLGWGESADAHHMTAPQPEGEGAVRAMREALENGCVSAGEVDYVNLHGTGTFHNDGMEARAMAAVFPSHEERPLVSSTKPVTGHTLGAAGALELALCWLALGQPALGQPAQDRPAQGESEKRFPADVPPHCWDGVYDRDLPSLRFAEKGNRIPGGLRICMSNSFAFGGCNVSLIIGKRKGTP
jgi:3-oxoacyl-[acyl-carrier-protein] synthase-1